MGLPRGATAKLFNRPYFFSLFLFVWGYPCPRDLRTAHRGGRRISFVVAAQPRAGSWFYSPLSAFALLHTP